MLRIMDKLFDVLSYEQKLLYNTVDRPYYGYGLLRAAELALHLGHRRISAIEFGVAGGNGLLSLEGHAKRIKATLDVDVDIYGFDSGQGMPAPVDYRDLPYLWQEGFYAMDQEKLNEKLKTSRLFLGPVEQTIDHFLAQASIAPVGFIAFDLDYYSSTTSAFQIFRARHDLLLPRVVCYFDDIVGDIEHAYNEFTGELRAIHDFNAAHEDAKLAPVRGLRYWGNRTPELWYEQMFVAHLFRHSDYQQPISASQQLPLLVP